MPNLSKPITKIENANIHHLQLSEKILVTIGAFYLTQSKKKR
jgi:hypothetical protein